MGPRRVDRTPFRIANGGTRCTRCRLPKHAPNVSSMPRISDVPAEAAQDRPARTQNEHGRGAVFLRYLFVVLDLARHQWRSVNGTFGVSRLVMRGDEPHPVPGGVVETLIATADAQGILQLGDKLQIGAAVRLMAGPFAEQLAILDHLDDTGRVRVLLDILGRQVAISTLANNLVPLP